jgi:hypothetical protein
LDAGTNPRDRKVEKPRRVGSRKRQAAVAVAQDSRAPDRRRPQGVDERSVEEDGPGNQTVSQGGERESPRGESQGSTGRSIQDLEELRPGNEALKRTCSGRMERHQGTAGGQGTGNRHPSGRGEAPKGESRERCGRSRRFPQGTVGSKPSNGYSNPKGGTRRGRKAGSRGPIAPDVLWRRETS